MASISKFLEKFMVREVSSETIPSWLSYSSVSISCPSSSLTSTPKWGVTRTPPLIMEEAVTAS